MPDETTPAIRPPMNVGAPESPLAEFTSALPKPLL